MILALGPPPTTGLNLVKGKGTNHELSGKPKHAINNCRNSIIQILEHIKGVAKEKKNSHSQEQNH